MNKKTQVRENNQDPAPEFGTPMPRELTIAAVVLVAVMLLTSVALWFVAGAIDHEQGHSDDSVHVAPTAELLQTLASDLGTQTTVDDLHAAVSVWLEEQAVPKTHVELASTLRGA